MTTSEDRASLSKTSSPARSMTSSKNATPTRSSPLTRLFTPSKTSTLSVTLTPTKLPPSPLSPPVTRPLTTARGPKRRSGWKHIEKLFSILPEHKRNALLRDYVPGEEPKGLNGYENAVENFKVEERWQIRHARARLTASTPQRSHQYSRSVIPTINVENLGPPSPVGEFWTRENGSGSGWEGRMHSRYHSM